MSRSNVGSVEGYEIGMIKLRELQFPTELLFWDSRGRNGLNARRQFWEAAG